MMKIDGRTIWAGVSALALSIFSTSAYAQETSIEQTPLSAPMASDAEVDADADAGEIVEVNPDDMADQLNSAQQLQQTITLERTIDGEVVETEKRTVTYSRDQPYRETEAGKTTLERIRASFDGEALTRTEAFEEAKLDFVIADIDRNEKVTAAEFATLVDSWRKTESRQADAPTQEIERQRQYDAFLEELDPSVAKMQNEAYAKEKFSFMAGASETLSLQDYIREYMLDFDSMDLNSDMVLSGDELMRFRALNRGETLDM